jgi:hypothetical protein
MRCELLNDGERCLATHKPIGKLFFLRLDFQAFFVSFAVKLFFCSFVDDVLRVE